MNSAQMNTTYFPTKGPAQRQWYIVDADGQAFGRLVSKVARYLMGKTKPTFTPHADFGDFVVVVNASRVRVTGRKRDQKSKFRHTEYPGGARFTQFGKLLDAKPEEAISLAVKGMLPKTKLGSRYLTRLRVYRDTAHKHAAQKLVSI